MKRLLTTLVILTGLLGSGGAAWADALDDYNKGYDAYKTGDYVEAAKWYRKAAEQGLPLQHIRPIPIAIGIPNKTRSTFI